MKYLQDLANFFINISRFEHQMDIGDVNRSHSSLQSQNSIQVPYSGIKLNLYHAFKLLSKYYDFTAENDDYIILVYDFDKRLIRESILINFSGGENIIQDVISDPIPEDFNIEGEDSNVYHSVNKFIQSKYSVQIGRVKIIEARLIETIMEASLAQKEKDTTDVNSLKIIDLFLDGCKQNLVRAYPEMPMLVALKRLASVIPNFSVLLNELRLSFKDKNIPITLFDDEWYVTFLRKNNELFIPELFEFDKISIKDQSRWKDFVNDFNTQYFKKYHAKPSYFVDINWCIDFLSDVCESEFPLTKGRFEYLLQRFLYFIAKNEDLWDVVPKPIIYNGYIRLLTRLLGGFHINPKKLSYWSLPSNLTHFFRSNYGPNDQIIFLVTENEKITGGWMMKLVKGAISEIIHLDVSELDIPKESDETTHNQITSQFGFTKSLIFLEKSVLTKLLKYIIIDRNSKNPLKLFSGLGLLGKLNNKKCFRCYPELPWYSSFKKTGAIRSFRKLNRLLYDFLEF